MTGHELADTFFRTFIGENVEVITIGRLTVEDIDEVSVKSTAPLSFAGKLIDVDDEYYYLGEDENNIQVSIQRDKVISINLVKQVDPLTEMLENAPIPSGESGAN